MDDERSAQRRAREITLASLPKRGLPEELAKVFDSEAAAKGLLELAEVPQEHLVPFGQISPTEFWEGVCRELNRGLTVGGLPALLRAAVERYPANEIFQDGLSLVTPGGDGSPPPGSEGVAQRGPSPFIVGPPIEGDEDLFGRQRQRNLIRHAIVRAQQPVQVLGKRRMGKTSLLRWVQRHAPEWQKRPVVWINAQGLAGHSPEALVLAVAEELGQRPQAEDAMASDGAVRVLKDLLPLLLLVDEAAILAAPGHGFDAHFLGALREFGQERQLIWVSASHHDLRQLFEDTGTSSPFLNDAREAWVGQIEPDAARSLVARLDDDDLAELAIEHAGGFAYGLQWLADALWEDASDPEATCDEFYKAMEDFYFRRWWDSLSDELRGVLRQCVDGVAKSELASQVRRRARRLVSLGFLAEKDGSFVVPGSAWRDFLSVSVDQDSID